MKDQQVVEQEIPISANKKVIENSNKLSKESGELKNELSNSDLKNVDKNVKH